MEFSPTLSRHISPRFFFGYRLAEIIQTMNISEWQFSEVGQTPRSTRTKSLKPWFTCGQTYTEIRLHLVLHRRPASFISLKGT